MEHYPDRETLINSADFQPHYAHRYESYRLDTDQLGQLSTALRDKQVDIVLGTWCGDSQVYVPRFLKVLDAAQVPATAVTLICVDKDKKDPLGKADALRVDRVPTFIIKQDNLELGRIVESPETTLEQDLLHILNNKND